MNPKAAGELELPAKIGNYRIEERLGSGGMGIVYRAYDEALQRPLAIKRLLSDRASPTASQRFRREARAAARLNHPAIVHIYDIVETDDGDWIVMELVEGRPLDSMIPRDGLDLHQALRLGREIVAGLAEAHDHGIVHRDLKASNVMVTASGRAKILDFGLAKFVLPGNEPDLSQVGIVLGTSHAMSPEQAQGLPLDQRSDFFSLGSLLYEMLTGVSPFRGATAIETLTRICTAHPLPVSRLRPDVPAAFSELVERLLMKEAGLRPRSAKEIARALETIAEAHRPPADPEASSPGADLTLVEGVAGPWPPHDPETPSRTLAPASEPSRLTSERRQVTVVCCELVNAGETSGSSRSFDPETLYDLMMRLRTRVEGVAGRYGGHLGSILGRRVLIYFGYPQAHEDNASRAVRAALELADQISQSEAGAENGAPLRPALRVGIHTGPAIVAIGPQGQDPVTLGATLDRAVELQSLAEPGSVVVSSSTCALIEKSFGLELLAPVRLPGEPAPLILYRVLQPLESREESSAGDLLLIGREQELALLLGRWDLVREGTGQGILISGEAGIGKSRLAKALRQRLGQGAVRWLSCFGSPYSRNSPLRPVVAMLRQAVGLHEGSARLDQLESFLRDLSCEEALPLLAALLDLPLDGRHPALQLTPERQKEKTLEALTALVLALAERQPLVFMIEDLHWLDPTTLAWLDRLIDQVPTAPLFLVLTLRLQGMETAWNPSAHLTQISLQPLNGPEAEKLIDEITKEKPLPAAIRRKIVARTDGVPLFLEELTKSVLESGESGERHYLPATLRDSLAARLDRLGTAKEVAQLAAVIGRVFSLELLSAVSSSDERTLHRELQRLMKAELIYRKGFGAQAKYLFKHALVQDAAYDSFLKRERQQIHRQIAETLKVRFPELADSQPELLAHHYTEAGLIEPAIEHWCSAGTLASSRSANLEAISHLNQALRLLESLSEGPERDRRELSIQTSLGTATIGGHGFQDPGVMRAYSRAEHLAERLDATEERFWAVLGLHLYALVVGDLARARELVERLLRIAEDDGSPNLIAIGCFSLGNYHYYQADFESALAELDRAYELAPLDDVSYRTRTGVDLRVSALSVGALVLWHLGYPERARRRGEQAIGLARELGQPFTLVFARGLGGAVVAHYLRDAEVVRREASEVHDLSVELGFGLWIWQSKLLLKWARSFVPTDEDPEDPQVELESCASTRQMIESLGGVAVDYYSCLHTEILMLQGCAEEALKLLERGLPLIDSNWTPAWSGEIVRLQGEILCSRGEGREACPVDSHLELLFRQALEQARRNRSLALELRAAMSLASFWQSRGRGTAAYDLLAGIYQRFTEGLETHDLQQARALLETLSPAEATSK